MEDIAAEQGPKSTAWKSAQFMREKFGPNRDYWPKIGCGANFVPWAKRHSMVCEIELNPGRWEAFLSARLPQALDAALKEGKKHELIKECFDKLNPLDIHRRLPITLPMTHLVTEGGVKLECAARYPIATWNKIPEKIEFTVHTWATICMAIAEKSPIELHTLLSASKAIADLPVEEAIRRFR